MSLLESYLKQIDDAFDAEEFTRANYMDKLASRDAQLAQSSLAPMESKKSTLKSKGKGATKEEILEEKNNKTHMEVKDLKNKCSDLETQIKESKDELTKILKEKEELSKYLFEIEGNSKNDSKNKSKKNEALKMDFPLSKEEEEKDKNEDSTLNKNYKLFNSQSVKIDISGNEPKITIIPKNCENEEKLNLITKSDLMNYLFKIYKENQSLRNFQNQIFTLSKTYDDINKNLADCISDFQEICKDNNNIDTNLVNDKMDMLEKQIMDSLDTKQNEFNTLLAKKDEEINLIQSQFINMENELRDKKDQLEEQKKIMDLYARIDELKSQIDEINPNHSEEVKLVQ